MTAALRLEGQQIDLRDWLLADLEPLAHWLDPRHPWHELDGPYYPDPTEEQQAEMIAQRRERILSGDWPTPRHGLAIAHKSDDRLVGMVGWSWVSEETWWPEIGIAIYDDQLWGRGIGTEALTLWGDYLFAALPEIQRLDLRTWSGNRGMMRLAERLGYTLEARFRKARIVKGQYYDGLGYGVLREEWAQRRAQKG